MGFDSRATPAEIVRIGHPALRHGTRMVAQELFGTPALDELIDVMRATLAGKGVGLAAPQIAVPLRVFVIEDSEDRMSHLSPEQRSERYRSPYPFEAIVNPTWHATSARTAIEQEGCLSIPGFRADVPRYWAIEVDGYRPDGERKRWSLEGWPARIFQHEIDHLDGWLLTDRMLPRTLASTEPHGVGAPSGLLGRLGLSEP
ncbi:peptide deformylase [Bradyrhizobium sp.]|uniref:peptide deformylase n=1 Tax=Bradyrhizobium sp. TaxID=376 RepID=UPI003C5A4C3F